MESKYTRYLLIGLTVFCIALIGITSFSDGWHLSGPEWDIF